MTPRPLALGALLAALLPVGGSTTGGMQALAPVEVFADRLDDPRGLAIDTDDNVFVAERSAGTVLRLTGDGRRTSVARGLKQPFGLAIDAQARVIVSEEGAGRVLRLDAAKPRLLATGLRRPRWLAVGDTDTIYVVVRSSTDDEPEDELDAIVAIRPDGSLSTVVDRLLGVAGIVTNGRELHVLLRDVNGLLTVRRYEFASDGSPPIVVPSSAPDALRRGAGLARDRLGALWMSAQDATIGGIRLRDVVVKLSSSRTAVFAHNLDEPRDLAFGPDGDLYVIDAGAGRILRFRPPPPPALDGVPKAVSSTALPLRGVATPDARIDVFVNDAETPATTIAGADGIFTTVVVIAQSTESRLEAFATAARGDGLSSAATVVSVAHDGDEPDLVFVRPPATAFVRRDVTVEAQAADAGGITKLTLDAGGHPLQPTLSPPLPATASRASAAWDTTGASDGTATVTARAVDGAGNERVVTRVVVVDNTAPDVEIVDGPGGEIPDTVAGFRFTATDNLTPPASLLFAWRVDDEEFRAFTGATTATTAPLAPGPHRFEVKARDLAGNEAVAASRTFTVVPGPVITAVSPGEAEAGAAVSIVGERLGTGPVHVTFNGTPAAIRRLSSTSLVTSVPPGATSGPLTVVTATGTATRPFSVQHAHDVRLVARPTSIRTVIGLPVTVTLTLEDAGVRPFVGLAVLDAKLSPTDIRTTIGVPALTGGQSTTLTIETSSPGAASGPIVIEATTVIDGATIRRTVTVQVDVLSGNHTALGGRLVLVDETPISGARVTLAGATIDTDAGGNFLFVDAPAGRHMLGLDVNAARAGLPIYAIDVEIAMGVPTRLPPLRITPPPPPERFVAIDNAARDQVVTDDRLPGFALTLPAGVTITGWDGALKRQIAIGLLTADTLPVPPPDFPARTFYQVFFGTPMGGLPSQPLPITLPNDQDLSPGEIVEIWYYDAAPIPGTVAGWRLAGDATVTADGTRAVSNPGVGLARFCGVCGIACIKRKIAGQQNVKLTGVRGGDPVDLATGLFVLHKTDLALPGRIPAFVHRVYNGVDAFGRVAGFELATGPGWTLSVDLALIDDGADARVLVMPGNMRATFSRTGEGTFANSTLPDLADAVLHIESAGHRLVFKDGRSWRFRGGWRVRGRAHIELTGLGLLMEVRDRHGNVLTIDRDMFGAATSIMEPAGRALTLTTALLDPVDPTSARLVSVGDALGRTVHYGYDDARRLTTVTDAAGGVLRYHYDVTGRLSSIADARGITYLINEYDDAGRVVRQRQADGGLWHFDYSGPSGAHATATVTDPRGAVTVHRFVAGRSAEVTDALGQSSRQEHDNAGRITAVEDTTGRRMTLSYDARGNVTRLTDPLGRPREIVYDAADRPQSVVDALGGVVSLAYDTAGHLMSAVDTAGVPLSLQIDALGQPVRLAGANGQTTRVEYAPTGEAIALVDPLGRRTTLEYDAASRLIRRRDPAGRIVDIVYDALDRIVQLADASGVVRYEYDANSNLLRVVDQLGRATRYEYDVMDRRVTKTDARGVTERYDYDAMGNVIRVVDRKGQVSLHDYDLLGRRVGSQYADGSTTAFAYDAGGRLVRAVAGGDTILLEYDALNRLTAETSILGTTRYDWDAAGRRTTVTRPDGRTVTYGYEAAGRLTRVEDGSHLVELEYDASGRRRRVRLPGGIVADYRYDDGARLTALTYSRADRSLGELVYAYDELDRRVAVSGSLASVLLPDAMDSAVYDAANRPVRAGDRSLTFDANGNLTELAGPSATRTFVWDALDRLVAIGDGAGTTSFAYDAFGRRAAREDADGSTMFVYDITDVVGDVDTAGERPYMRGITPDELFAAGDATPIVDGLGSIVRLVDPDGGVRDALAYEPFGRTMSSASTPIRYGFTGRERERDDLYYYRARYYHTGLGRFLSEDPLGLATGVNAYVYAFNDPVNVVDPTGLRTYVLHGIWPDRAAFDDFAAALRTADPHTRTLPWNGSLFGGVVPSTQAVATQLMNQILADLDADPLGATEKLNFVGFSGGGLVSATLAEMLRARGVKVDTVVTMGTPAQSPLTTVVPSRTRLLNFVGVADPLVSFRLHPRGTNYLILATHTARSYTENDAVLALVRREIVR